MNQHNLGRWEIVKAPEGAPYAWIDDAAGHMVARLVALDHARLIAAAPELYDACQQALAADESDDLRVKYHARQALDAAIAKAKGQSA